jgi:hypothetical protein
MSTHPPEDACRDRCRRRPATYTHTENSARPVRFSATQLTPPCCGRAIMTQRVGPFYGALHVPPCGVGRAHALQHAWVLLIDIDSERIVSR